MLAFRFKLILALLMPISTAQELVSDRDRVFASYGTLKTLGGVGDDDEGSEREPRAMGRVDGEVCWS